jgi:uncharacterized membrane protein YkgB
LESVSRSLIRYSVVLVLAWIGLMKFTSYEAEAIQGLVASSPFMAWLNAVLSVQGVANLIGVTDLLAATLLAARPWSAKAGVAGAVLAIGIFLTTLSFLFTAPGWEASLGGFPALSVVPGQFLIKDTVLLSACVFLLADAWKGLQARPS